MASFARAHKAVASSQELAELGFNSAMRSRRAATGEWQRVLPGVYLLQTTPPDFEQRLAAVQKWAGPQTVFSHGTAAFLHGMYSQPPSTLDIVVPHGRRLSSSSRCKVWRTRVPVRAEGEPPRTGLERTVLDLVDAAATTAEVLDLLMRGIRRGMKVGVFLKQVAARSRVRHRVFVLRLLQATEEGIESPLELDYHRDVERAHGLPRAVRQKWERIRGRWLRSDTWYEDFAVRVELDGQLAHPGRATDDDLMRDNDVRLALDEITLRYRWAHVHLDPCLVAAQVAAALAMRGWNGSLRPCSATCRAPQIVAQLRRRRGG